MVLFAQMTQEPPAQLETPEWLKTLIPEMDPLNTDPSKGGDLFDVWVRLNNIKGRNNLTNIVALTGIATVSQTVLNRLGKEGVKLADEERWAVLETAHSDMVYNAAVVRASLGPFSTEQVTQSLANMPTREAMASFGHIMQAIQLIRETVKEILSNAESKDYQPSDKRTILCFVAACKLLKTNQFLIARKVLRMEDQWVQKLIHGELPNKMPQAAKQNAQTWLRVHLQEIRNALSKPHNLSMEEEVSLSVLIATNYYKSPIAEPAA